MDIDLDQFKIHDYGYTLESGFLVTPANVDDLSGKDTIELCKQPSNARDSLLIRKTIHDLANAMQIYMSNVALEIDKINAALICTVHNGEDHDEPIAITVAKLAEQHRSLRKRERFIKSLKENAIPLLFVLFFSIIATAIVLRNDWIITVLIPIIWGIIKLFLNKPNM